MALNFVEKNSNGEVYEVKVSAADVKPEKYVPLPRAYADTFEDVSNGFTDPVLGEVSKEDALKFFHNGWNLARRSKTVAANSIDKRIDNAVKRLKELAELSGTALTDEQIRAQLTAMGIA